VRDLLAWLLGRGGSTVAAQRAQEPHAGDQPMKVILGLGNPGPEYERTRHNVGWWVLDHLAERWQLGTWKKDGDARVVSGVVGTTKVRLVKPLTFYNLSGNVLRPYLRRPFWAAKSDLLVVCDDVALPVGSYRFRSKGSAGGSNGLKSIEGVLKTQEYPRLRIGTAPADERRSVGDLSNYVLSEFGKLEQREVLELMPRLQEGVESWLREGIDKTMNQFNRAGS
jgi:peptidyl-tRNA hydrolase, PTH1 family